MANGFEGSKEEFRRMEAPLLAIDGKLSRFATENGLELTRSGKWPDRSLNWRDQGLARLIQIFIADERQMAWSLWLCAYQDRDGIRYWKQDFLLKAVPFEKIEERLEELLREGRDTVTKWQVHDLEPATTVRPIAKEE